MFSFFRCHFLFYLHFFWTRGMSLEWVWRFFKLSPNSYVFFIFFVLWKKGMSLEFGVTLEILQTQSKLAPNSCFFSYVTTEKTASPGSPAKLS